MDPVTNWREEPPKRSASPDKIGFQKKYLTDRHNYIYLYHVYI